MTRSSFRRLLLTTRNYRQPTTTRHLGMRTVNPSDYEEPPPSHSLESVKPPLLWSDEVPPSEPDPMANVRNPVSSAYMIDLDDETLSEKNQIRIEQHEQEEEEQQQSSKKRTVVVHGNFGELAKNLVKGIPLEYLALLGPSAEGAAAVNSLSSENKKGTLLVFGASQPAGLSAVQLGVAEGHAVVAVVGGEHSGNDDMCDIVKGLIEEPGFMVPEEYAVIKQPFKELVEDTVMGNETSSTFDSDQFLTDFKQNVMDYAAFYPETLPAAVSKDHLVFQGKDKDRTYFRENMEAYLEQFPKGAPKIPEQDLLEKFPKEQYAIWKSKFGKETTKLITENVESDFHPAEHVKQMMMYPETLDQDLTNQTPIPGAGEFVQYEFSVLNQTKSTAKVGGPIVGAILAVTPFLKNACEAVDQAKTLREKAEALQFLPKAERSAFAAASSVVAIAKKQGVRTIVVGG